MSIFCLHYSDEIRSHRKRISLPQRYWIPTRVRNYVGNLLAELLFLCAYQKLLLILTGLLPAESNNLTCQSRRATGRGKTDWEPIDSVAVRTISVGTGSNRPTAKHQCPNHKSSVPPLRALVFCYGRLLPQRTIARLLQGRKLTGAGDGNRNRIPIQKPCVLAALPPSSVSNGAKWS